MDNPPCRRCVATSAAIFPGELCEWVKPDRDLSETIYREIETLSMTELQCWTYGGIPFGSLCIPSLRWAMRKHHLCDNETNCALLRKYLASAVVLATRFEEIFERIDPRALVVFNGISYPEAVARHLAKKRNIPVITHEVGLRPYSAFFSHTDATFREVALPAGFKLGDEEDARLDAYLAERWKGKFTMAGIQFWPEMQALPDDLEAAIDAHQRMVSIFPNVIFDTSQVHANVHFEHMFAWLDDVKRVAEGCPETLFVIRAHPDEDRPGKKSRESVAMWVESCGIQALPNVRFYSPSDYISSYDLIRRSKFVLVYNSSIGLEAAIMGAPVLCAGRGRYTQLPTVFFPESRAVYDQHLASFLSDEPIHVPHEFVSNARKFLYYELYHASLDLSPFLKPMKSLPGFVSFTNFDLEGLDGEEDSALRIITDGILEQKPFVYPWMDAGGTG